MPCIWQCAYPFRIISVHMLLCSMLTSWKTAANQCAIHNFRASCDLLLPRSEMKVSLHATVNYCNSPLDVTFKIMVHDDHNLKWQHSFANSDETQEVAALSPLYPVKFRVQLSHTGPENVRVEAAFYEGGMTSGDIINSSVIVNYDSLCRSKGSLVELLPLIVFIALLTILAILGVAIACVKVKQHGKQPPQGHLLGEEDNVSMEQIPTVATISRRWPPDMDPPLDACHSSTTLVPNQIYIDPEPGPSHPETKRKHRRKGRKREKAGKQEEEANQLIVHGRTVYKKVDITDEY